jgi:hypothetical protein
VGLGEGLERGGKAVLMNRGDDINEYESSLGY